MGRLRVPNDACPPTRVRIRFSALPAKVGGGMSLALQASAAVVIVLIGVLIFSRAKKRERTLRSFFWADQELSAWQAAMLMLATSLSLNGLLYQSWLGYKVGIYSAVIQIFWCAGFILLYFRADRFFELTKDTIHGQFHATYGKTAGVVAAIASTAGFASLAGWELSIAASLLRSSFHIPKNQTIYLLLLFAFIPALYTLRGGLRGNVRINIFLNLLACIGIVALIIHLLYQYNAAGMFPLTSSEITSRSKLSIGDAITALGGAAIISNLLFSFFWQTADMNMWENSSGAGDNKNKLKTTLLFGAVLIFFAPGVVGAILGITVQHIEKVNESNLLEILINETARSPLYGTILYACLIAVMLSTLDGLFLSGSLSFAADVVYPAKARKLIRSGTFDAEDKIVETKILSIAYIAILAMAIIGSLLFLLVLFDIVDLFNMVYLAVIGQMSLVPGIISIIFDNNSKWAPRRCGACSVLLALGGSWLLVILAVLNVGPFGAGVLNWMPMITIALGTLGLLVPNNFFGGPKVAKP